VDLMLEGRLTLLVKIYFTPFTVSNILKPSIFSFTEVRFQDLDYTESYLSLCECIPLTSFK